jgi:uncharacterized protein YgiM (DUF1202 family)
MKSLRCLFLLFLSVACSLTTPPTLPDSYKTPPNKTYLTTPTKNPEPTPNTIPETCTVSAQSLHLRECAGLHCSVIAWLSKGEVLVIQEKDQNWIQVTTLAGQTGWVHSKYCGGS